MEYEIDDDPQGEPDYDLREEISQNTEVGSAGFSEDLASGQRPINEAVND